MHLTMRRVLVFDTRTRALRERVRVRACMREDALKSLQSKEVKKELQKNFLTFFALDRGHLPKSVLVRVKGFFHIICKHP